MLVHLPHRVTMLVYVAAKSAVEGFPLGQFLATVGDGAVIAGCTANGGRWPFIGSPWAMPCAHHSCCFDGAVIAGCTANAWHNSMTFSKIVVDRLAANTLHWHLLFWLILVECEIMMQP